MRRLSTVCDLANTGHSVDKAQLAEAKQHLVMVLQGKMGSGSK